MKRKAKTLALLGLGSVVVLGLLYWGFPASSPFTRSKADIFAEAYAKGEFKRCYWLMGDDYWGGQSESEVVGGWEKRLPTPFFTTRLGGFKGITRLAPRFDNTVDYDIQYTKGTFRLHISRQAGDENSPIGIVWVDRVRVFSAPTPTPNPTPSHNPIS